MGRAALKLSQESETFPRSPYLHITMIRLPALIRPLRPALVCLLAFLLAAGVSRAVDRNFETLPSLRTEARRVVDLLEEVHYNGMPSIRRTMTR